MKKILFIFLFVLISVFARSQNKTLILSDSSEKFIWERGSYSIYIDSLHNSSLKNIIAAQRKGFFKPTPFDAPRLQSFDKDMWANLQVINTCTQTEWLIELYDFHVDAYDIYILKNDSLVNHFSGGDMQPFTARKIKHKNFIHEVAFDKNTLYNVYIRIQSKQSVAINGVIRTYPSLLNYSNKEYTLLTIFYGVLLLMIVYCACIYFVTLERTYLYFTLNIASVVLYSLSNDGLGFQYVWSNHVLFNEYAQSLSVALFSATSLLYSTAFLRVKDLSTTYCLSIRLVAAIRMLVFLIGFFLYEPLLYFYQFDILILIFIFYTAIYFYKRDYKAARFFILAYTTLFIGFTLHILMILGIARNNILTVYGLSFGVIVQLFLFSFALADRVRLANIATRNAQIKIISQLKENEALKDQVTKELEEKVKERTQELEFKNQQLDAFVYKASHDIKGPLKSIIGLARLGLLDVPDPNAQEYFKHIETSSSRLDNLLQDLLQVAKIKNMVIESTLIDFQKIIGEIKEGFMNIDKFSDFEINVTINQDRDFYSDEKMMYSIFQNLIENSFTYRNTRREKSILNIRIEIDKKKSVIEFADNGIGINKDLKDKVFDMFFRASDISGGTGLGLYLVKMAVNKIGGRIHVETEVNKGTTFTIVI